MFHKLCFTLLLFPLALSSCRPKIEPTPQVQIANPASVYCEDNGGTLEIRSDDAGNQAGMCVFPDGSECEEWAYFRGECAPAGTDDQPQPTDAAIAGEWTVYRDEALGLSFEYPANATIESDDQNPSLTIVGPVVDNEAWPMISISYPGGENYLVPEGADLKQWMIDHNLYVDEPRPDEVIAGTTAVHLHYPRGQQSYAADRYFFVHNGRMFIVMILHTGDKEDWDLYNRFLQSITFE